MQIQLLSVTSRTLALELNVDPSTTIAALRALLLNHLCRSACLLKIFSKWYYCLDGQKMEITPHDQISTLGELGIGGSGNSTILLEGEIEAGSAALTAKSMGWSPQHLAANRGHAACLEMLYKAGVNVHESNQYECTPLHYVACSGSASCVELLTTTCEVNVDTSNKIGWTALHYTSRNDNSVCTEQLIIRGADVNFANKLGATPLHDAAECGNYAALELLLANGADVDAKCTKGSTPLQLAIRNSHTRVVNALQAEGAQTDN